MTVRVTINTNNVGDYLLYLKIKRLPKYAFTGHVAEFPDEYAPSLGIGTDKAAAVKHKAPSWMFDYQRDITELAIKKRKFALFMDCGLGKTPMLLDYARVARRETKGNVLIVSPLMVVRQTISEFGKFFPFDDWLEQVPASGLQEWLSGKAKKVGITNYEAIRDDLDAGRLSGLILDESSMLKSHYGKWGTKLIEMGRGLEWKLCATGTPAPNDRIEYANHAVFLDAFPTVNSFLAKFFVNRGQTDNRWELKPHALKPFYTALSHWSIFVSNPSVYGWRDNCESIPPIHVHIHEVDMTEAQQEAITSKTGKLFADPGGITSRSTLGQIAKGNLNGQRIDTLKPEFIRRLVDSWPDESTIIWCLYNEEQDRMAETFPDTANITGDTPYEKRQELIDDFKAGSRRVLISKGKILGFGLNLQKATRQVFSGLQDSYETYYQCVKRSNRIGSDRPLNVHIPVTEAERPMIETVLRKAKMVQQDTEEQEALFRENQTNV